MSNARKVAIIGLSQDLGASRRGVDMGPSAIRVAGLHDSLGKLGSVSITDYGNILSRDIDDAHSAYAVNKRLRCIESIIENCNNLKITVERAIEDGSMPLVLGGDHSITIGTMAGMKKLHSGKTGILWIDAHGDFNTDKTTLTGNIHGQPFAVITGRGDNRLLNIGGSPSVLESHAALVGARDIDPEERDLLRSSHVRVFTMREIDKRGIRAVAREAIQTATEGVDFLHVSFDIDAVDPTVAPGTGTPVPGGISLREAFFLMEEVHSCRKLGSFEMVEVNPALDNRNTTAATAVKLIRSALGSRIL